MSIAIQTNHLSHRFSAGNKVLDDVNLAVPEGSIYGFLGPNGAGKTTTLRLVLGLIRKQEGEISIFGKTFNSNRIEILNSIGSLIETPSIYSHLNAIENLCVWQKIYQCKPDRMEAVLKLVGLSDTGKKKAGKFSLGMKQRLSIAIALLHEPRLLILDEPTNGLDPQGILEMRALLKELNEVHGITIVISSHLLAEIERMVTHVGIIDKGQLRFQGTLDELNGMQEQSASLVVDALNRERALAWLTERYKMTIGKDGKMHLPMLNSKEIASLNKALIDAGIEVCELSQNRNDLETIFMNLIQLP